MKIRSPTKEKEQFRSSGIRRQGMFIPQLFPSMNEYSRMAAQTFGIKGHRGTMANNLTIVDLVAWLTAVLWP